MFAVQRFYHASPALSTPHRRSLGHPHPPHLPLSYGDFRGLENAFSYTMNIGPAPVHDLFDMADQRQHREHRLDPHTVLPRAALAQFEIRGIALRGMEAGI